MNKNKFGRFNFILYIYITIAGEELKETRLSTR